MDRLLRFGLPLFVCTALACSSNSISSNSDGGTNDHQDGSIGTPVDFAVPEGAFSVGIGPLPLMPGQEETVCITLKMPNTMDVDVVQLQATLAPGSHHLILYRSNATSESTTPTPCTPFEGVTNGEVPIMIAESLNSTLKLPTNVAYHFAANQMVKIEAHYINASPNMINGAGQVVLTPGASSVTYQPADIMFCGSTVQLETQGVPANNTDYVLNPGFYSGNNSDVDFTKIKVFAFTSHEHHLGKEVTISKSTSASDPGTMIYDNTSWDAPPLTDLDDQHLLTFNAGEGLRWQCSYDSADANPKPTGTTTFGQSAIDNEMCFIWAYYYPSVGRFVGIQDCAIQ